MAMRSRFRLWLKKRGGRRSGSQRMALSGELLYHAVFIVVGAVALWLHATNVLAPARRLSRQTAAYTPAQCEVIEKRTRGRQGPTGWELQPECLVRLLKEDTGGASWPKPSQTETPRAKPTRAWPPRLGGGE